MLVLTRRAGESIVIGDDVRVVVLDVRGDTVRLGIEAPRSIQVHRAEVYAEVQAANAAAAAPGAALDDIAERLRRIARPAIPRPAAPGRRSAKPGPRPAAHRSPDRLPDRAKGSAAAPGQAADQPEIGPRAVPQPPVPRPSPPKPGPPLRPAPGPARPAPVEPIPSQPPPMEPPVEPSPVEPIPSQPPPGHSRLREAHAPGVLHSLPDSDLPADSDLPGKSEAVGESQRDLSVLTERVPASGPGPAVRVPKPGPIRRPGPPAVP